MIFKINFNDETHVMRVQKTTNFQHLLAHIQSSFKRLPKKFVLTYIDEEKDEVSLDNDFDLENLVSLEVNKVLIKIVKVNEGFEEEDRTSRSHKKQNFVKEQSESHLRKSSSINSSSLDSDEEQSIALTETEHEKQNCSDIFKGEVKIEKEEQRQKMEENEKVERNEEESVHQNVQCTKCLAQPLVGTRYKCSICSNLDLCQNCEATFSHQHAMLKIKHSSQQFSHPEGSMQNVILKMANRGVEKVKSGYEVVLKAVKDTFSSKEEEGDNMNQKKEEKEEQVDSNKQKDEMVEKASYLSNMLNIELKEGYCFVKAHPGLHNQELVAEYLKDEKHVKID